MNIQITARHIEIRDKLKAKVEKEISKLEKFYDGIISCDVIFSNNTKHNHLKEAEITLSVYEHKLTSKGVAPDPTEAFNLAFAKMEKQLKKFKEKLKSHR